MSIMQKGPAIFVSVSRGFVTVISWFCALKTSRDVFWLVLFSHFSTWQSCDWWSSYHIASHGVFWMLFSHSTSHDTFWVGHFSFIQSSDIFWQVIHNNIHFSCPCNDFFTPIYIQRWLYLPPLRFLRVGGYWDWTQDCRDFDIWRSDILTTHLDLIHTRLCLIHTRLDLIHTRLDLIHTRLDLIHTRPNLIHNSTRSHLHSARSHPHSATSHPHSARSHPYLLTPFR